MSSPIDKDGFEAITIREHHKASGKRGVLLYGFDGANYNVADVDTDGALATQGGGGGGDATAANQVLSIASTDATGASVASIDGKTPSFGQNSMGASVPVVLASNHSDIKVSMDGEIVGISNDDTVSTNNSTTTPLAGGGNFTGTGDDLLGYTCVSIHLSTDANSATDGMKFEFSPDNSNWDDVYSFTYDGTDGARRFQFPVCARYFRVNYTTAAGGPGAQGHFRVQSILHRQNLLTSIHRAEDDVSTDRSATLVKSIIVAQTNGAGDFSPIQASGGGVLKVSADLTDNAGNDIGDVDVASLPTLPAGDNNIGNVDVVTLPDVNLTTALMAAKTIAFGSIASTFAAVWFDLSAESDTITTIRSIRYKSTCDTWLAFSLDGGSTIHDYVAPHSGDTIDFYSMGLSETGDIWLKYVTEPSRGDFAMTVIGV